MPKQYVVFGRPVPRVGGRRISVLLVALSIFAVFSLLFTLPSAIPTGPSLQLADRKFAIPKSLKGPWINSFNPFKTPSHPPPAQKNDTYGEAHWFANWRWLSVPFSSSFTLDDRSLLPVLRERPAIYCYYDHTIEKDDGIKDAESDLLLTWRRAWWAQGFKPIILGPAEAMRNPVYEEVQRMKADPTMKLNSTLETDMMRWLAWDNMGGGLLANSLLFPMASYNDPLLAYLRRGEFPALTRWQGLGSGLFAGPKGGIAAALKLAIGSPALKTGARDLLEAVSAVAGDKDTKAFDIDDQPDSLAFYDATTLADKYSKVADLFGTSRAEGFTSLNQLITSHLHLTWQNLFSDGISVVKPLPHHTTHMIRPAYELAKQLAQCHDSPVPQSCPPNRKCSPCTSSRPMKIRTPPVYQNSSTLYVIGTVPHPYTTATLTHLRDSLDTPWIRRTSPRDPWVIAVTKEVLGAGMSAAPRILRFKDAVASEFNSTRCLWLTAEDDMPTGLEWHFGFAIPTNETRTDESGSETTEHDLQDGPAAKPEELKREPALLARAREVVHHARKDEAKLKKTVESWNLADTEAWKFTRAYRARETMERKQWEEEEMRFAGGAGTEKGPKPGWGRWLNRQRERWSD
ncbi:hypothetical protein GQ53DRAFT_55533 [Thozetella sp. PMI_491]|nr:hypothetical protein GQ53DRAFT_55533 [Thozetella sp. PMI_491]